MIDDKSKKVKDGATLTRKEMELEISKLTKDMNRAAKELDFELAANLRDEILELKAQINK
jgi:excinuclease ABC subunit B